MNDSLSRIRWLRVIGAALAVMALSFLMLMAVVVVYAFVLAFEARGAPNQNAINRFAAWVSPKLMAWLEMLLTLGVTLKVAQRVENAIVMHCVLTGILAGLLGLAVTLAFSGRLGFHNLLIALVVMGSGWLGGFVGERRRVKRELVA